MSVGRRQSERPSSPAVRASRTGAQDSGQVGRALSTRLVTSLLVLSARLTPTSMSAKGTAPRDASLKETVGTE